jgi:hypothetical protein
MQSEHHSDDKGCMRLAPARMKALQILLQTVCFSAFQRLSNARGCQHSKGNNRDSKLRQEFAYA